MPAISQHAVNSATPLDNALLAGVVPFTTLDYPGQLACVAFVGGCPWRCGYCHNPHLQRDGGSLRWPVFADWLEERRGLLDAVVFSGGEPTLAPWLPLAMAEVANRGYRIGLHSAGISPRHLVAVLPHCHWLGLDIKAPLARYASICGARNAGQAAFASLDLALQSGVAMEVRTTYAPQLYTPAELLQLATSLAQRGVRRFALQGVRPQAGAAPWQPERTLQQQLAGLFEQFDCR